MTYIVIIPSRCKQSESSMYERVLKSLLNQELKPRKIFFVGYKSSSSLTSFVDGIDYLLIDGIDSPPFMAGIDLINAGIAYATSKDHIAISGDDCIYPKTYFKQLNDCIEYNKHTGIISGLRLEKGIIESERKVMPSGSGRIYTNRITLQIFPHPYINCGETLFLFQCEMLGFKNEINPTAIFEHLRPSKKESLTSSGLASYELGYPLIQSIARIALWFLTERKIKISFLYGHIHAYLLHYPKADNDVLKFVKTSIKYKYINLIHQVIKS